MIYRVIDIRTISQFYKIKDQLIGALVILRKDEKYFLTEKGCYKGRIKFLDPDRYLPPIKSRFKFIKLSKEKGYDLGVLGWILEPMEYEEPVYEIINVSEFDSYSPDREELLGVRIKKNPKIENFKLTEIEGSNSYSLQGAILFVDPPKWRGMSSTTFLDVTAKPVQ
jgi:hypothetical protein